MKTTVINLTQRKSYTGPKGQVVQFVYIGRPSVWGNPFKVPYKANKATRDVVIEKYRSWLRSQPALVGKARRDLKGKVLVCHCKPKACHGDVLAEVAEGGEP